MSTAQKRRVIHVPLTDKEWRELRTYAVMGETTIGALTAAAIRTQLAPRPTHRETNK